MNIVFPQNNFLLLSTIAFEIREVFMIPEHFKLKTHLLKFSKTISVISVLSLCFFFSEAPISLILDILSGILF